MKQYRRLSISTAVLLLTVGLAGVPLGIPEALARPAQDQQPTPAPNGPSTQPGETVLVPKKTQPAPAPPAETKPEKINPKDIYSISTTTNLVNVDVLVTDKDGDPINSLGKTNFRIYDDGVEQTVSNFGTSQAPLTVCLLVEFANRYWPYLYLALQDAYDFLGTMRPQDWVAVVEFDFKTHILTDFTQDRGTVRAALDTLRVPGFSESNLYDALAYVIDRMKDIQGRKAIIPICTGIDTFSKITYGDMLKIAKASDTPIYPISTLEFLDVRNPYGGGMAVNEARIQLNYIAQYSGGQAYFPRFQQEIPSDYQQIAGQLRDQYSLGFVPTNPAHDGKYHKLKVDLVDSDGSPLRIVNQKGKAVKYKILARDGYYSPKS
jgi:VWFA-related protein